MHNLMATTTLKQPLFDGKNVVITSGLLNALEDRGIKDIVEMGVTERRAYVDEFIIGWAPPVKSAEKILIPQIQYLTNDSWELIGAIDGPQGWPLLHDADYANGHLYVLTVPDKFADLYELPTEVLTRIKRTVTDDLPVRVDAPAGVSLFVYDNDTFIVESFLDEPVDIQIVTAGSVKTLRDIDGDAEVAGELQEAGPQGWFTPPDAGKMKFSMQLKPHTYRAFSMH